MLQLPELISSSLTYLSSSLISADIGYWSLLLVEKNIQTGTFQQCTSRLWYLKGT